MKRFLLLLPLLGCFACETVTKRPDLPAEQTHQWYMGHDCYPLCEAERQLSEKEKTEPPEKSVPVRP